jgi:hypothetical protein
VPLISLLQISACLQELKRPIKLSITLSINRNQASRNHANLTPSTESQTTCAKVVPKNWSAETFSKPSANSLTAPAEDVPGFQP